MGASGASSVRAAPRESVTVGGVDAEVDAQGGRRARVRLVPGQNVLALSVLGTDGAVRLFDQRVDVVARDGGWLVVPRAPEPRGALRLPGTELRLFGKPASFRKRRMGVALARATTTDEARAVAKQAAAAVRPRPA